MGPRGDVVLGLSFDFHDAAAALLVGGELVAAAEQERFSRRKHDDALPADAIAACLEVAGIRADEIGSVVFYEKPVSVADRYLAAKRQAGLGSLGSFVRDAPTVFGRNLAAGARVALALRRLGAPNPPRVEYLEHHLSHAAAAYYPSPFDDAAILTIDGIGEWATTTVGWGRGRRIDLLEELRYPDSLGLVYSFVTAFCGFRPNEDEYKVMGLAPYGVPRFAEALSSFVPRSADGSFQVRADRLGWFQHAAMEGCDLVEALDGPPRAPGAPLTQREADIAASLQQLTEMTVLHLVERARELVPARDLCLAGGVALNCVANGKVLRSGAFERIWIQPAAGDAGSAVGAAFAKWHLIDEHERPAGRSGDQMRGAALGPRVPEHEVERWLSQVDVPHRTFADRDELHRAVADHLAEGAVVGWFQGAMEFGPRALGHRSILADPRNPTVRERLNRSVKGREDFRPFAPCVLAEHAPTWFDLDHPSPYMLLVAQVRDEHLVGVADEPATLVDRASVARSTIPACTHVDGSARIQTVTSDDHVELHGLLRAFHERTGCPLLVNTSFNRAGDPIVRTPDQALQTARDAGMDVLVVEHALIALATAEEVAR